METKSIVKTAIMTALIAVCSWIQIPMPSGVPITLQTFAIALSGVVLGLKKGCISVVCYIFVGIIGIPVFSGFKGGFAVVTGVTGGFIWGFIPFTILCGIKTDKGIVNILIGMAGLIICHIIGILQFSALMRNGFLQSALIVSVPYLIKDIFSVALAYTVGERVLRIKGFAKS